MKNKLIDKTLIITTVVSCIPFCYFAYFYNQLPDQIATHFNSQGIADGYSSKAFAAIGLPLLMVAVNIFVNIMVNADPKQQRAGNEMTLIAKYTIPVLSNFIHISIIAYSLHIPIPIHQLTLGLVGCLFILLGNYMPKTKRNYTIGIKIPWTLNSDENWNKTHRFGGYIFMISGILVLLGALFNETSIILVVLPFLIIPVFLYSYLLYKKGI